MVKDSKIVEAFALSFVNDKQEIIKLLNSYGASIKSDATNEKVLNVFKGFITSNRKFATAYSNLLFKKGYLKESDITVDPSEIGSDPANNHLNFAWEALVGGGLEAVGGVGDTLGSAFKRPEINNEGLAGIMALEQEKLKLEAEKTKSAEGAGKYIIAGSAIIIVGGIVALLIAKRRRG